MTARQQRCCCQTREQREVEGVDTMHRQYYAVVEVAKEVLEDEDEKKRRRCFGEEWKVAEGELKKARDDASTE